MKTFHEVDDEQRMRSKVADQSNRKSQICARPKQLIQAHALSFLCDGSYKSKVALPPTRFHPLPQLRIRLLHHILRYFKDIIYAW